MKASAFSRLNNFQTLSFQKWFKIQIRILIANICNSCIYKFYVNYFTYINTSLFLKTNNVGVSPRSRFITSIPNIHS